jgi:ubiquinone/menaquinone biosynthesis C-methylase UbiE
MFNKKNFIKDNNYSKIFKYYSKKINYYQYYKKLLEIFFKRLKAFFFNTILNKEIDNPSIKKNIYEKTWSGKTLSYENWFSNKSSNHLYNYKNTFFLASSGFIQRIHQYSIYKIIKKIEPKKVLEVGSGNGINLNLLSSLFLRIKFTGLELTRNGIVYSRSIKKIDEKFYNGFFIKGTRIGNVNFIQGNAKQIPFLNNSFDLVFTVLALEQMNSIYKNVIKEMVRVSSKYLVFIEPFQDLNSNILSYLHHRGSKYLSLKTYELEKTFNVKILFILKDFYNKESLKTALIVAKKM